MPLDQCQGLPGRGGEILDTLANAYQLRPGANVQPFVNLEAIQPTHDMGAGGFLDYTVEFFDSGLQAAAAGANTYQIPRTSQRWQRLTQLDITVTAVTAADYIRVFRNMSGQNLLVFQDQAATGSERWVLNAYGGGRTGLTGGAYAQRGGLGDIVNVGDPSTLNRMQVVLTAAAAVGSYQVRGHYVSVYSGLEVPK